MKTHIPEDGETAETASHPETADDAELFADDAGKTETADSETVESAAWV